MSLPRTLLGLLRPGPTHGYDLKRAYDDRFGQHRQLHYGQVYSALARLLENGLVEVAGVEPGDGPERKRYAITTAGVTELASWLTTAEKPTAYLQSTLYTKVVLAMLSGRSVTDVLDTQRSAHLASMRELVTKKADADLATQLICDHALFHLDADLRWLELTASRIDGLRAEVNS